jgi:hypothetical protein
MEEPSADNLTGLTELDGRRSIAGGLAFFDIFRRPLTLVEAWRWQGQDSARPLDLLETGDRLAGLASHGHGLYRLPDGQANSRIRWRRYRLAEAKFRRARSFAWWARFLPSVRLVAVGNSLAWSNAEADSDIDLFVVTAAKTIWTTRLVLGGFLKLFGLRPTPTNQKDKLCLSFLVSEAALDLSGLMTGPDDVYFRHWLAALVPLYDAGGLMERLWQANRSVLDLLPAAFPRRSVRRRAVPACRWLDSLAAPVRWLLRGLEPLARRLQERLFPEPIRRLANRDSRVVVNDRVLKFHVDDRRELFSRLYREKRITAQA